MKNTFALAFTCVLGALTLAACSSPEKQERQAEQYVHTQGSLLDAQRNATVTCAAAQCDAAWALTQRYIAQFSNTKIASVTNTTIDTEVPSDDGDAAFSATRVPLGTGATLTLFAQCRGMYAPQGEKGGDFDKCAEKILKAQNGYVAFIRNGL